MRSLFAASAACLALTAGGASANDSSAELATGGLVLTKNADVEMRSEDLFISAAEIHVGYRFYNASADPVTTLVAFPMPDISVEGADQVIALPTESPDNMLGFETRVDGKAVATSLEQKVIKDGVDRTDVLLRLNVPLAPHLASTSAALDRLPRSAWDELIKLRLAEIEEYDIGKGMQKHLSPRWTLKTTYSWEQTFPPREELSIEHRYKPSVGASVQTSIGNREAMQEDWFAAYRAKYCLDDDFLAAVAAAHKERPGEFSAPFSEERISYILTTGGNWNGPIGDFRLVVDKSDASSLVSFCGEGVRKIGPTRFAIEKTDFTPKSDLHVLILKRLPVQ
jgi:hypothetical protein